MEKNEKYIQFKRTLTKKCEDEHEDFDSKYEEIKEFTPMEKKIIFLHYKMNKFLKMNF